MNNRRYTLSADDVRELKRLRRIVFGGKTSQRPVPTRRRNRGTKKYYIRVRGTATSTVSANTASFDVNTVELLEGAMPVLTGGELTIQNAAKIPIANGAAAEFRWNEDDQQWETEPLACHQVLGKATAAVSGSTFSIDNIELVCGSDPRTDPSSASETLSVANPFAWNIDDNGDVLAVKKADGTWIAVQADCPA